MTAEPRLLLEDPELIAIAPLVLAAWDDAFLTPAELLEIRGALESASSNEQRQNALRAWLDPKAPPSVRELRSLRAGLAKVEARARSETPAQLRGWRSLLGLARAQRASAPTAATAQPLAAGLGAAEIARLQTALDGPDCSVRNEVRQLLQEEPFRAQRETEMIAYRDQVLAWVKQLSVLSVLQPEFVADDRRALRGFAAAFETIAYFDLSVTVKFGVQFGLFASAIQNLGTVEHKALLPAIRRAEILGCFAMTERGHGSNVRDLQTRAVYDADKHEFVITTPELSGGKEWIGSAAKHARMAVVFAQLEVAGEACGVHALLVPIRDVNGELLPFVRAEDCGHKMGLNGVDNGRLWFENVRVPHSALLDRFGRVTQGGQYESPIPSPSKRFFSMLGTLIGGRVNVAGGALSASKVALTIALRYAAMRRQFPDHSGVEQPLLDYLSHRARLLPGVAYAYAFSFAQEALLQRLTADGADPEHQRSTEALAAGLKAIGTWRALDTLQKCRECCGGQGYLTTNRLDPLRTDADVFTTFEGDNTVLCQQLAKELLRESMSRAQQQGGDNAPAKPAAPKAAPPPAPKLKAAEALLEGEVQRQALQFRERMLLETLSVRIERRLEQGADPQAAFESCQDHVLALAQARMECFVLDAFQAAVAKEPLLGELCTLYALSCIEEDVGVFLEHEYLAPPHARALRDMRRELLGRCAARGLDYTAAFGIPEHCLGPLADRDYVEASGLAEAAKKTAR